MLGAAVALSDLWPSDAVVVQRPSDDSLDWLRRACLWADRSSATPLTYAGELPIICHEAAVRPGALELLSDAGLRLPPEIIPYTQCDEMLALVADQVRRGRRLGITYTSREPWAPAESYVNPPDLVAELNDKASLADLLPPEAVPERRVVEQPELAAVLSSGARSLPLVLKASSRLGSGAGADVLICCTQDDLERAGPKFAPASRVVVERFYQFSATWCVHFALSDERVRYCGTAQQICDAAGTYLGNWSGAGFAVEPDAIEVAYHAARAGWSRGYRGFMGLDIGRVAGGGFIGFDLNFRNNGSTPQVLLGAAIGSAWGAGVSRLCLGVRFSGAFESMVKQLAAGVTRRELVPLLAFDTPSVTAGAEQPMCNVLVAGDTVDAVDRAVTRLAQTGFTIP